jgi:hypothetical protein
MSAALGRLIGDYGSMVEVCRQRAEELEISRSEIDRLSGLPDGYSSKILGKGYRKPKRMWPIGLEAMLGVLGLKILLLEDEAATARTLAQRDPVDRSNQRFGNRCNSKPSLKIESSVEIPMMIAAPPKNEPAPHAHLRVIQDRRRGSKWG